jgi:hypothetical protein
MAFVSIETNSSYQTAAFSPFPEFAELLDQGGSEFFLSIRSIQGIQHGFPLGREGWRLLDLPLLWIY